MKLLFQKKDSEGFFREKFSQYTRWKLKTQYPHGAVLIGDKVWHSTIQDGLHQIEYDEARWDSFNTDVSDELAESRLLPYLGCKYDAFSLIAFELPFSFSDQKKLYCFEAQWLALTGDSAKSAITPDTCMGELLRRMNSESTY